MKSWIYIAVLKIFYCCSYLLTRIFSTHQWFKMVGPSLVTSNLMSHLLLLPCSAPGSGPAERIYWANKALHSCRPTCLVNLMILLWTVANWSHSLPWKHFQWHPKATALAFGHGSRTKLWSNMSCLYHFCYWRLIYYEDELKFTVVTLSIYTLQPWNIFSDFPKQLPEPVATVPDEFEFVSEGHLVPALSGTLYEGFSLLVNMDVCVYAGSN